MWFGKPPPFGLFKDYCSSFSSSHFLSNSFGKKETSLLKRIHFNFLFKVCHQMKCQNIPTGYTFILFVLLCQWQWWLFVHWRYYWRMEKIYTGLFSPSLNSTRLDYCLGPACKILKWSSHTHTWDTEGITNCTNYKTGTFVCMKQNYLQNFFKNGCNMMCLQKSEELDFWHHISST